MLLILNPVVFLFPSAPIQKTNLGNVTPGNARLRLISAAESYLGTPYRYGGFDRRGMDCSGLVYASFRDALEISVPRTAEGLYYWAEKIPAEDLQPGDLVFFTTAGSGISHVGIFTGGRQFIHAASEGRQTGVMYSSLDETYWRQTFFGAGRAFSWDNNSVDNDLWDNSPQSQIPGNIRWTESAGLFFGLGMTAGTGGFLAGIFSEGSLFRGLGFLAKTGYKGFFSTSFQIGLEFRPEWDRFLGIWRLPLTLSLGGDTFQVYAGPAITIGEPQIRLENHRTYTPGFAWLGELGISAALRPIQIASGCLSFYLEMAWQPYFSDTDFNLLADLASNLRMSAGLRYLWLAAK